MNQERLHQVIKLLKFLTTLDDVELIKISMEAAIEVLEEEVNKINE